MVSNAHFFTQDRQIAAVLKHGVLSRYLSTYAGMTSSASAGKRVGYIDGYAGAGEYLDEITGRKSPGSPSIALSISNDLIKMGRRLECVFVEKVPKSHRSLVAVLSKSGNPYATALLGDVREHLSPTISKFDNAPLLIFLDPFGTALETEHVLGEIARRPNALSTEVLLNFSVDALRRIGGRVFEEEGAQGREATLARVDDWLGGGWWRDVFLAHRHAKERANTAAEAVFREYVDRFNRKANTGSFAVPVRRSAHQKPIFYLVLFFRRMFAAPAFNDAVSLALDEWRKMLRDADLAQAEEDDRRSHTPLDGMSRVNELTQVFAQSEMDFKREAIDKIKSSIRGALATKSSLSVRNDFAQVFGEAIGEGRELHLRAAWKELAAAGFVEPPPTGKLAAATINRAAVPVLPFSGLKHF